MPLPPTLRVKLSSEAAEAIALTPVIVRDMPLRELIEEILPLTGKDAARVAEVLGRGTLVGGGTRFRWEAVPTSAGELREMVSSFAESDPSRAFAPERCVAALVIGGRRRIEVLREAGDRKRLLRRTSFWDELMRAAGAGCVEYLDYSYRRRADHYSVRLRPEDAERLREHAGLLADAGLRRQFRMDVFFEAELYVERRPG